MNAEGDRVRPSQTELDRGDDQVIEPRMAVRKTDLAAFQDDIVPRPVQAMNADHGVGDLSEGPARVHDGRPADGRGYSAQPFKPRKPEPNRIGDESGQRRAGHRYRPTGCLIAVHPREPGMIQEDDQLIHAAVIHEQVRAVPEHPEVRVHLNAATKLFD